jgi:GNAT superfamily N-acetyltransferase
LSPSPPTRPATPGDIPELVRLINEAYRVEAFFIRGDRTSTREIRSLMEASDAGFLVVDNADPGRLAGAVYVEARGARGHFGLLAVDPGQQGKGLGRRLVAAVEAHCRQAGCVVVELEVFDVRTELHPFYASCGYVRGGDVSFARPELLLKPAHLVVMRKALGPARE